MRDFEQLLKPYPDPQLQASDQNQELSTLLQRMIAQLIDLTTCELSYDTPTYQKAGSAEEQALLKTYYQTLTTREILDAVGMLLPKLYRYSADNATTQFAYAKIATFCERHAGNQALSGSKPEAFAGLYDRLIKVRGGLEQKIIGQQQSLFVLDAKKYKIAAQVQIASSEERAARQRQADLAFHQLCEEFEKDLKAADAHRQKELKAYKERLKDSSSKNRAKAREVLKKDPSLPAPVLSESERLYTSARDFLKIDLEQAIEKYQSCFAKALEEKNPVYLAAACLELSEIYSMKAHVLIPNFTGSAQDKNAEQALSCYEKCVSFAKTALHYFNEYVLPNEALQQDAKQMANLKQLSTAIHLCLTRAGRELQRVMRNHQARVIKYEDRVKTLVLDREKIKAEMGKRWYDNPNPKNKHAEAEQQLQADIQVSSTVTEVAAPFLKTVFFPVHQAWALVAGQECLNLMGDEVESQAEAKALIQKPFVARITTAAELAGLKMGT